jgi:hypothetical protein
MEENKGNTRKDNVPFIYKGRAKEEKKPEPVQVQVELQLAALDQ